MDAATVVPLGRIAVPFNSVSPRDPFVIFRLSPELIVAVTLSVPVATSKVVAAKSCRDSKNSIGEVRVVCRLRRFEGDAAKPKHKKRRRERGEKIMLSALA